MTKSGKFVNRRKAALAFLPVFLISTTSKEHWQRLTTFLWLKKRANGVIVMSSYGDKLVGDDAFKPIWKCLDDHKALIFVHPGHVRIIPENIAGFLPQPVIDYPQATTRAALSIVLSGIFTECQNINVILSHGGGTLPYLGARAVGSLLHPAIKSKAAVSMLQA